MYNNSAINPPGKCKVQLQNPASKKKNKVNFTIINDQDVTSNHLLGCSTVQNVITDSTPNQTGMTLEDIKASYSDVFEGLRLIGPELHLDVDENAKPVQLPPRKVLNLSSSHLKPTWTSLLPLGRSTNGMD